MISVTIPVGPYPANKQWLREALDSCKQQTMQPEEVLLIDDGAGLSYNECAAIVKCDIWHAPWRMGISHSFNVGVAIAVTNCVFMLGSDDTLEPTCLERCWESYQHRNQVDGYYSVPIRYMDTQEVQTAPCNAAMVTKGFWRKTGGFPIETSMGMGDHTLLSICIAHKLPVYWVGEDTNQPDVPLYNYRRHPDIHTFKMGRWFGVQTQIEEILTRDWQPPEWGDNYG